MQMMTLIHAYNNQVRKLESEVEELRQELQDTQVHVCIWMCVCV